MSLRRQTTTDTRRWCENLVLELRLRDVKGARIGDEVASVESHCAESGQSAQEAFGDAREYAAALEFEPHDVESDASTPALLMRAWPTLVGLAGFYVASWAITGRHDPGVTISLGQVVGLMLTLSAIALIIHFLDAIIRRVALFVVIFIGAITLSVLAAALLNGTLLQMPTAGVAAVSGLLLLLSVVGEYRLGDPADPVVDPVRGGDFYASRRPRVAGALAILRPWLWPIAAALLVVTSLAIGS